MHGGYAHINGFVQAISRELDSFFSHEIRGKDKRTLICARDPAVGDGSQQRDAGNESGRRGWGAPERETTERQRPFSAVSGLARSVIGTLGCCCCTAFFSTDSLRSVVLNCMRCWPSILMPCLKGHCLLPGWTRSQNGFCHHVR
ncbi:hypothetical protein MRX96_044985 [Rhipicephalus microplus]